MYSRRVRLSVASARNLGELRLPEFDPCRPVGLDADPLALELWQPPMLH